MSLFSIQSIQNLSVSFADHFISSLSKREKAILATALAIFSAVALWYFIPRCCHVTATLAADEEEDLSLDHILRKSRRGGVDEYHHKKAANLYEDGKYPEAVEEFKEALKLDPKNIDLLYLYSLSLRELNLIDEAAEQLKEALKIGPKNLALLGEYAETLFTQGKMLEAKSYYEAALKYGSKDPDVLWGYGNTLSALEELSAPAVYLQALKLGCNLEVVIHLSDLVHEGKLDLAMVLCQEYMQSKDPAVHAARAETLILFATSLRYTGSLDKAESLITEILKRVQAARAFWEYAEILSLKGRFDESEKYFCKALRKDAGSAEIWSRYGLMLIQRARYRDAAKVFNKALKLDPQHINSLNQLAFLYSQEGWLSEAKEELEKVLKIKPNNVEALSQFAEILVKEDNLPEAIKLYELSLSKVHDKQIAENLDKLKKQLTEKV